MISNAENVETLSLGRFARASYLNYAMYVILNRAIPHISDGLKPVQRRIVYAMSELALRNNAKHKKAARTVGDVLGKYHPHGDSACYEAMVLMAQDFSCRYPIVDGQGNWGSVSSPKEFAAMRYTEARLAAYADIFLTELGMDTVEWIPNFDGTMEEPRVLPARLPNVILNGTSGIAVGMATDIPPHNLREIVNACILLIDHPEATVGEICEIVQGPDYPGGAEIITPREDILRFYETGNGQIRMRAVFHYDNDDLIITALPHQVSPERIMEQVADQMARKKLPMVSDVLDLSDQDEPVRIQIACRSNRVDKDALISHLFATTDLEKTFKVNMTVIGLNRKPQTLGLLEMLNQWIAFRKQTVTRRLEFRLGQINDRLHILEGLLIAHLHLDEVISIIRESDAPKQDLMAAFNLSEIQAEAILQIRLRQLAKMEEIKLEKEQSELMAEKDRLEKILSSEQRLKTLIKKELTADAETFGDDRRTRIVERSEAELLKVEQLAPAEPVTVILSANGWVRAAKGHAVDPEGLSYKSGDRFLAAAHGKSNQQAVFLDSEGRTYSLVAHSLPSARSQGEPLTGRFAPPSGARFVWTLIGEPERKVLLACDAGYGFVTELSEMITKNTKGKAMLTLPAGAEPLVPLCPETPETDLLATVTNEGRMLIIPVRELPELPKGKGNKIIQIPPARARERLEYVTLMEIVPEGASVRIHAGKRFMQMAPETLMGYVGERGRRGSKLPRGFQNVSRLEVVRETVETPDAPDAPGQGDLFE